MGGADSEASNPPGAVLLNAAKLRLRSRAVSLASPHQQLSRRAFTTRHRSRPAAFRIFSRANSQQLPHQLHQ
jgi:hypothetical protein